MTMSQRKLLLDTMGKKSYESNVVISGGVGATVGILI